MAKQTKLRLGELLVQEELITNEQLEDALENKSPKQKLGDRLIQSGYITELQLVEVLQQQLDIPQVRLYNYPFDHSILNLVPKNYARENLVIPLKREKNKLHIALADPLDYFVINDLRLSTGFAIEPVIATKDEIKQSILKLYEREDFTEEFEDQYQEDHVQDLTIEEEASPVVKLMNQMIHQAVVEKASDIHVDPQEDRVVIRFRVDGTLKTDQSLAKSVQSSLTTRIKIMAGLDITEQRVPQDGRIKRKVEGRDIDLRVSTLPTIFGEKIVIRVLDIMSVSNHLEELGFEEKNLNSFIKMIEQPYGIVLLTGPTGSGKTSTMYAALTRLNKEETNIITVEDPVEYQLDGVNQIQVNSKVGLTFASGLRSILRQDPDIIMVGEIRDNDTANMAVRASITGHLVLSTLHTNDSIGAISRLLNMDVEMFLVGSSLNGIVAQRLVRRICRDCAIEMEPTVREQEIFNKYHMDTPKIMRGRGCPTCNMTGYRGRTAIHEVLYIDDNIREAVLNNKSSVEIEKIAVEKGFTYLFEDGLRKVQQGITTTEEIFRVAAE
ncbi:type II secretion system protein GspE [Halalkalibacillus sediminis]|uniref:Type II secretion system protein GspE n=1 Tax=Halalkalibacillus sediminis TaxID=2018042 RepID=A0A2I0QS69_9BACI|nr:GspE/PulE family protein [Halalkalibacillus sediminis]PKR76940.1 type II secretion system protein GspE [Halalkalibacillus sediminis]